MSHAVPFLTVIAARLARPPGAHAGDAAGDLLTWLRPAPQRAARRLSGGVRRVAPVLPFPDATVRTADPAVDASSAVRTARDRQLAAWLADAAGGDAAAFERCYDTTIAYAQTVARRMLPPDDVEDVVADAYFQAWRDARHFDATRGSAVTWLLTIVRSRALDLLRRHKASPEVAGSDDTPEAAAPQAQAPADLLDGVEAHGRLHRALQQLSAQERWVLALAYYRELTHREVSEQTGLPLGTVKSLILRAQGKLRELLAEPAAAANRHAETP